MSSPAEDHAVERIKLELTIDALRDEVAYYRARAADPALTIDPMAQILGQVYGMTPAEIRLTLALYRAEGAVVSRTWLAENIPGEEVEARHEHVAVVAHRVRRKLGSSDAIQNVWGQGIYMSKMVHLEIAEHEQTCDAG